MGVSGNFAGLARMQALVSQQRISAQVMPRIAQRVAATTVALVGTDSTRATIRTARPGSP